MAHKSFKRAQNLDKIEFDIPGPNGTEIHFDCEDEIPSGVIFAFTDVKDTVDVDDTGSADVLGTVLALFEAAIVESQVAQFMELVRTTDKGKGIPVSMLMEIATWLGGEYTSRPTGQSSAGGQSVKPSGSGSTGGALHAVTTYSKPEPAALST
jgi:hypothetical protein